MKQKQSEESDCQRQLRLQKKRSCTSRLRSEETDKQRDARLEKDRLYKRQKREKTALQQNQMINQKTYLSMFNNTNNGGIEEQYWAKASIDKFHNSLKFHVVQCTICMEAWPLKSKPKSPYVCSRCSRDKKFPKKFSVENSMIPSSVPLELRNLTQIEEMLIARALPINHASLYQTWRSTRIFRALCKLATKCF